MRTFFTKIIWGIFGFLFVSIGFGQYNQSQQMGDFNQKDFSKLIGIDQKLGAQIPPEVRFRDEYGKEVQLASYFGEKPIILIPVFYRCSSACLVTLEESVKSFLKLNRKHYSIGKDYQVITFSIHPKEAPELAMVKKQELMSVYKDPAAESSWHFLTGPQESIERLTKAIGFRYMYDPVKDQIQHAAGIMVLTPQGRLSSYFYGSQFEPKLVKDALVAAKDSKIGQASEPLFFGCIHIDPITGQRSLNVLAALRLMAVLTISSLFIGILVMSIKKGPRKPKEHKAHS